MAENKNKGKQSIMDAIMNDKIGVEDALKESNSFDAEIREMAESQLKEEEKKEKAAELARMSKRAAWTNLRFRIEKNYANKCDDIEGDALKKSLELLNCLKEGKKEIDGKKENFTPTMYEKELEKLADESVKAIAKAGEKRRELLRELEQSFVGYYSYSWGNPFNRINRAIEDNRR
jgi:hypothetical protein